MYIIECLDQYKDILKHYRDALRNNYYNNYLSIDAVKRYIELKRLFCVEVEGGFLLIVNEEKYYHMFPCIPMCSDIPKLKLELPVLVRNIYREGAINKVDINDILTKSGFSLKGTTLETFCNPNDVFEKTILAERYRRIIEAQGFEIVSDYKKTRDIFDWLSGMEFISYYHRTYLTEEEIRQISDTGGSLVVLNSEKEICGAALTISRNDKADGIGIAVADKYRMLGLAIILNHERMRNLSELGIKKMSGWINEINEDSIRFHKSLGFIFTGRKADEWILEE